MTAGSTTLTGTVPTTTTPRSSETRRDTLCAPAVVNVVWAVEPVASLNVPSPSRSQSWVAIEPSESAAVEVNDTTCPICGVGGETWNVAEGALFGAGVAMIGAGSGGGAGQTGVRRRAPGP